MSYSIMEAAKAIGKTRQALQHAIKKGLISAHKNALGEWEIDPAELHRVYPPVKEQGQDAEQDDAGLRYKLEATLQLLEDAKERANELRKERDDWKQQAKRWEQEVEDWKHQVKALPPGQSQEQEQRKGFFARLLGR